MAKYTNDYLLAAKDGDVDAFEKIYADYKDRVYAIALSTLKNQQDAEDATQQTFIRVYEKLSTLEDPDAFNTWIQRIAVNESRMILRKRKEVLSMDDDENGALAEKIEDDFMLPQEYLERDDLSRRLREIIDDLPTAQRQALVLQMYSNLSMAEIAEVMECSENTVKSRIRYAKATIKTEIEERERKTGEKFYGVVMLPFGSVFTGLLTKQSMSPAAAAQIWNAVSQHILGVVAAAGSAAGTAAVGTGLSLGAKIAIGAILGAAVIGGTVFGITRLAGSSPDQSAASDSIPAVTQAVTESATQAPTQAPTEANYTAAYASYLEALTENETSIRSYDWQKTADGELRPIAFADVYGDNTPEMLVMHHSDSVYADFSVYSFENKNVSEVLTIPQNDFSASSLAGYYFFTVKGEKALYQYHNQGDSYDERTVKRFDDRLNDEELLYYRTEGADETIRVNGADADTDAYRTAEKTISDKVDTVWMVSLNHASEDPIVPILDSKQNKAMTYDEAIAFLKNKLPKDAAEKNQPADYSVIADSYRMAAFDSYRELQIGSDGSITITTREIGEAQPTIYTGKCVSITKNSEYLYTIGMQYDDGAPNDTAHIYLKDAPRSEMPERIKEKINGFKNSAFDVDHGAVLYFDDYPEVYFSTVDDTDSDAGNSDDAEDPLTDLDVLEGKYAFIQSRAGGVGITSDGKYQAIAVNPSTGEEAVTEYNISKITKLSVDSYSVTYDNDGSSASFTVYLAGSDGPDSNLPDSCYNADHTLAKQLIVTSEGLVALQFDN